MSDMLRGQANMANFDAICTFVFKDYKDFAKFMLSCNPRAMFGWGFG